MARDPHALIDLVVGVSAFMLVLTLWVGAMLVFVASRRSRTKKVEDRLGVTKPRRTKTHELRLWQRGETAPATVAVTTESLSRLHMIQEQFRRAGWEYPVGAIVAFVVGIVGLSASFVAVLAANLLLGVGMAIALLLMFRIYMVHRITSREALFEAQLVDAMELAARSLRAGHPLLGAFQLISEELAPPVSTVFGNMVQRHEMGTSLAESLQEAARMSSSADLKMFATSVSIQSRTGGNLAELIDRLSNVIRERIRLNRRVRVLTSQTQMSKRVLIALPFFIFILFNFLNPVYMRPLYATPTGRTLLLICAAGLGLGTWMINRMAVLKY